MTKLNQKLKHLDKLIVQTSNDSKSDWASQEGMVSMYKQDLADFVNVHDAVKCGHFNGAKKLLQYMDTLPREAAVVALAYDLGKEWVEENLEYEVRI